MYIDVLFCGGTIQCEEKDGVRSLSSSARASLEKIFMEAIGNNINELDDKTDISRIKFHQVHSKLSEEMDMNDWVELSDVINASKSDVCIVCHGTDSIDTAMNAVDLLTDKKVIFLGSCHTLEDNRKMIEVNIDASIKFAINDSLEGRPYSLIDNELYNMGNISLVAGKVRTVSGIKAGSVVVVDGVCTGVWVNPLHKLPEKIRLDKPEFIRSVIVLDGGHNVLNAKWPILFNIFDRVMIKTSHSSTMSSSMSDALKKASDKTKFFIHKTCHKAPKYSSSNGLEAVANLLPDIDSNRSFCLLSLRGNERM